MKTYAVKLLRQGKICSGISTKSCNADETWDTADKFMAANCN